MHQQGTWFYVSALGVPIYRKRDFHLYPFIPRVVAFNDNVEIPQLVRGTIVAQLFLLRKGAFRYSVMLALPRMLGIRKLSAVLNEFVYQRQQVVDAGVDHVSVT